MIEEESKELMVYLDPGHTNLIDCQDFCDLFETISKEKSNELNGNEQTSKTNERIKSCKIHGKKLKICLKKYINKNIRNLEKALLSIDNEQVGLISPSQLRHALENFCFPLTNEQFQEILSDFTIFRDRMNYHDFLDHYKKKTHEDTEKWITTVNKLACNKSNNLLSVDEVEEHMKEALSFHKELLLQDFKALDYCNVGIVRKDDVRRLLDKHAFRMNDNQFEYVWRLFPKNDYGYLKYHDFLEKYIENKKLNSPSLFTPIQLGFTQNKEQTASVKSITSNNDVAKHTELKRPKTASSLKSGISSSNKTQTRTRPRSAAPSIKSASICLSRSSSFSALSTVNKISPKDLMVEGKSCENSIPLPRKANWSLSSAESKVENIEMCNGNRECPSSKRFYSAETSKRENEIKQEPISLPNEDELKAVIRLKWREILKKCQQSDSKQEGYIFGDELLAALDRCGASLTPEMKNHLVVKYHVEKSRQLNYWEFLSKFVLESRRRSKVNLRGRGELLEARHPVIFGKETPHLHKIMLMIRDKVSKNWRELRSRFRRLDPKVSGMVDFSVFRKSLDYFNIKLSEEDVYQLLEYYDPNLTGNISYHEFLGAFRKF